MEKIFSIQVIPQNNAIVIRNNKVGDQVDQRNVAFQQSNLILQIMKNSGLLPYHEENYEMTFYLWDISVVYAAALYVVSIYNIYKTLSNNFKLFMDDSCDFNCQAFQIVIIILSLQTISTPILFWKQMNGICDYFDCWHRFQEIYSDHSKMELSIAVNRVMKSISLAAGLISGLISITICSCLNLQKFTFDIFITYFLISFSLNIGIAFWFSQCILIQATATLTQNFFQQLIETVGNTSQNAILICFEMWIALNNIMKSLANNFSSLISLLCFCSFLSALITFYCLVSQIFYSASTNEFEVKFGILNFILSTWTFSLLYILNDSSYKTTKEADFRFWVVMINLNAINQDMQNQVLELLTFFENQKPHIDLFGFEFLSREFLITISSTLITYIIIILQFRNTGVHSSTKLSNSTCSNITT